LCRKRPSDAFKMANLPYYSAMNQLPRLLSIITCSLFPLGLIAAELVDFRPLTERIIQLTIRDGVEISETMGSGCNGRIQQKPIDPKRADRKSSYTVTDGQGVKREILRVGRKAKGTEFARVAEWKLGSALTHWIYIELEKPLIKGRCTVSFDGLEGSFIYDWTTMRSDAVQVNQLGFLPGSKPKFAYLSHWMGSAGPLDLSRYVDRPFHLIDEKSGARVFQGSPRLRLKSTESENANKSNFSRADIYELDFSAFATPGEYRIAVEGIGCSYPFVIERSAYFPAYYTVIRGLYHQRSGISLTAPYTKFTRPRDHHPDEQSIYQSTHKRTVKENAFEALPEKATKEKVPYWGGYHDAGDWDRNARHLSVSDSLLLVYQALPDQFKDRELNIPESGNGLPDIVDEARFNLDCYARMQKADGGVCGGLESNGHPKFGETSYTDSLRLFAYAPDADSTFRFAATAATMHRVLQSLNAESDYLARAERAWNWATAQETPFPDSQAHAAAALFNATGKKAYETAFLDVVQVRSSADPLSEYGKYNQEFAVWTYVLGKRAEADAASMERLSKATAHYARTVIIDPAKRRGRRMGYNWWSPFGHTTATTPVNLPLIAAHQLTGEPWFLNQMTLNSDAALGGNALNICWVTGLGDRPCQSILHIDSWYDEHREPVPGLIPYGPRRLDPPERMNWTHKWGIKTCYPEAEAWPPEELWFGNYMSPVAAEYTVTETIGPAAAAYAYLHAWSMSQMSQPRE
jgi:endoglucanase